VAAVTDRTRRGSDGRGPRSLRQTVTSHGWRVRAYRDVLAACLPKRIADPCRPAVAGIFARMLSGAERDLHDR